MPRLLCNKQNNWSLGLLVIAALLIGVSLNSSHRSMHPQMKSISIRQNTGELQTAESGSKEKGELK
jgi:hypothetical protein